MKTPIFAFSTLKIQPSGCTGVRFPEALLILRMFDFCIQGGMGIITNSRAVGDDFYLEFLVAWRFGTSLVFGLSVWQKRLSPIVQQRVFVTSELADDIPWYPEIPVTQSFSTFSMFSMAFSTWWAIFLKGVHRGVSFCERLNVVSSNMAAAETCLRKNNFCWFCW